jgi:hypothetical protein
MCQQNFFCQNVEFLKKIYINATICQKIVKMLSKYQQIPLSEKENKLIDNLMNLQLVSTYKMTCKAVLLNFGATVKNNGLNQNISGR